MKSVIFVCTANLCRSPMAAAIFAPLVQTLHKSSKWTISSAGTWTQPGMPIPPQVLEVMALHGYDLSAHRSRLLDGEMLKAHALVLTMEAGHKEALCVEFPDQAHKVYLLSQMVGLTVSLADPRGYALRNYEKVYGTLLSWLDGGKEQIFTLAGRPL
jgi:protein-tyrosine phosphatase